MGRLWCGPNNLCDKYIRGTYWNVLSGVIWNSVRGGKKNDICNWCQVWDKESDTTLTV